MGSSITTILESQGFWLVQQQSHPEMGQRTPFPQLPDSCGSPSLERLELIVPREENNMTNVTESFIITQKTIASLQNFLLVWGVGQDVDQNNPVIVYPYTGMPGALCTPQQKPSDKLSKTFARVSERLTDSIRNTNVSYSGKIGHWNVYIRFDWEYFVSPAAYCIMGLIFIVYTIAETKSLDLPAWKESAMPVLAYGSITRLAGL